MAAQVATTPTHSTLPSHSTYSTPRENTAHRTAGDQQLQSYEDEEAIQYRQHAATGNSSEDDDEFHDASEYNKNLTRPSLQPAKTRKSSVEQLPAADSSSNNGESTQQQQQRKTLPTVPLMTSSNGKASKGVPAYAAVNTTTSSAAAPTASSRTPPSTNTIGANTVYLGQSKASPSKPAYAITTTPPQSYRSTNNNSQQQQPSQPQQTVIRNLDTGEECDISDIDQKFPEMLTLDKWEAQRLARQQQKHQHAQQPQQASNNRTTSPNIKQEPVRDRSASVSKNSDYESEPPADAQAVGDSKKRSLGIFGKMRRAILGSDDEGDGPNGTAGGGNRDKTRVRTKVKRKNYQELSDVHCVQSITEHTGPIWTFVLSHDGQYIATGGQDSVVRVWAIMGSEAAKELQQQAENPQNGASANGNNTTASTDDQSNTPKSTANNNATVEDPSNNHPTVERAQTRAVHEQVNQYLASVHTPSSSSDSNKTGVHPIVYPKPYRTYVGHKADIVDLAWSKANFLLSASIDKTVRLWHITRPKCLCMFMHSDFVTSVAFHPVEDRYFLSASFDKKLRVWNIPEHRVVEWTQTSTIITACAFSPNGQLTVAGLYNGQCIFYVTEGLKYYTQVECRNRRGKYKNGKKVTGLQFTPDGKQLLVTTNDSRIRLYDMDDYRVIAKFKGTSNDELQIRAYFDETSRYIICGSENESVYVWSTQPPYNAGKIDAYEYFKACADTVTCARMLPRSTIRLAHSTGKGYQSHYGPGQPGWQLPASASVPNTPQAATGQHHHSASVAGSPAYARPQQQAPTPAAPHQSESEVFQLIVAAGYNGELKFYEERGGRKQV